MKTALIITFDFHREKDPQASYSVASLKAYCETNSDVFIDTISVNLENKADFNSENLTQYPISQDIMRFDCIALGCYFWSVTYCKKVVEWLRKQGYKGVIVMGGYEITYSEKEKLSADFPGVNWFLCGNAEVLLQQVLLQLDVPQDKPEVLQASKNFDLNTIPAVYAGGYLKPAHTNRLETQRGCPYQCTFCAHRDVEHKRVYYSEVERALKEAIFLNDNNAKKINFLDPVFNTKPSHYLPLVKGFVDNSIKPLLSFQVRPELLVREDGVEFLEYCSALNVELEFGLQTIHALEDKIIKRSNDIFKVKESILLAKKHNVPFEISILYGLPNQTVDSFQQTIDFCYDNGCETVVAFPLKLYKGTELYYQKEQFQIREKNAGRYDLPYVISANTFTEDDWHKMHEIAQKLNSSSTKTVI